MPYARWREALGRRQLVAQVAELGLGAAGRRVDHLGADTLAAEASVGVGLGPAQAVVHVHRRDAVTERM